MAGDGRPVRRRPVDAAALIVVRRRGRTVRVLTGLRSDRHAFMPGMTVFPGGRVDRADYAIRPADALDPAVEARLLAAGGRRRGHVPSPPPACARPPRRPAC